MRVSELAKELGYKAAELVEVAKIKSVKLENARATVNARLAMQIRAHVPHRSKLTGDMLDQYKKIQEIGYETSVTLDEGISELIRVVDAIDVTNPWLNV